MSNDLQALHEAFARYEDATARVATGHPAPADQRALRQARVALCQALERSGCELPDEVRTQLVHDRTQLARDEGLVAA